MTSQYSLPRQDAATAAAADGALETHAEPTRPLEVGFPTDFVWGAATASYQIEGHTKADGRGTSIWDTFAATPGKVLGGDSGDPGADHYRRYREDVALIRSLGIGNYRFSIAWPRVQPDGRGRVNPAGLDFYSRLVDELLSAGIEPWVTLYHWDLPQSLEDDGGWPNRDTALRFADYAAHVHAALGDRVTQWSTLNEPWVSAFLGYASGDHAPGRREPAAALAAVHHLLLGHGLAATAIRERAHGAGPDPTVGIVLNTMPIRPHSGSVADQDAARRIDGVRNRIFLDPLYHGRYPEDVLADVASITDFSFVRDGDLRAIAVPLDYLGINFYGPALVAGPKHEDAPPPEAAPPSPWVGSEDVVFVDTDLPRTGMGWEIDATGLTELLVRHTVDYPTTPLYVTENGAAFPDEVTADDAVHDEGRLAYLDQHVRAAHAAIKAGAPLRGYFVWSLLDNFEWAYGYSERFGIVYVDYASQRRIVKDSGSWYSQVVNAGGIPMRHN